MKPMRTRVGSLFGVGCLCAALGAGCAVPAQRPSAPVPPLPPKLEGPSDLLGRVQRYTTTYEDTLVDLAVQHDVGYVEMIAANPGVDPWLPGAGTQILLPKAHLHPSGARVGIVVNVPEQRLYYYPKKGEPLTFPIGIGREGYETPLGVTKVVGKKKDPVWYPGPSARADDPTLKSAIQPGPDNPLGSHALYLGIATYLIHGTNMPYGVGRRSSRGCVRLYPADMEKLFSLVAIGTPVRITSEAVKFGWYGGELYMEVHPSLEQATELEDTGHFTAAPLPELDDKIKAAAGAEAARLDWDLVREHLAAPRGIPVRITRPRKAPDQRSFAQRLADALKKDGSKR